MIKTGIGCKILDDKMCFDLWNEFKTLKGVQAELMKMGLHGSKSENKPPTEKTISDAAWRYVLNNPVIARKEMEAHGLIMDDKIWKESMVRRATYVFGTSRKRFVDWIKENELQEFEYIYKRRMGTID